MNNLESVQSFGGRVHADATKTPMLTAFESTIFMEGTHMTGLAYISLCEP